MLPHLIVVGPTPTTCAFATPGSPGGRYDHRLNAESRSRRGCTEKMHLWVSLWTRVDVAPLAPPRKTNSPNTRPTRQTVVCSCCLFSSEEAALRPLRQRSP